VLTSTFTACSQSLSAHDIKTIEMGRLSLDAMQKDMNFNCRASQLQHI
jgi:hypothetical protein